MIQAEDLQSHFQIPDGTLVDFTETFYNGDTLELQWTGWDSYWTDPTIGSATANLYVASWNFNVSDYSRILACKNRCPRIRRWWDDLTIFLSSFD